MPQRLIDRLTSDRMALIVSLPRNDPALARAAVHGGADALKVHFAVDHVASGVRFGTLEEERPALTAILEAAGDLPVGVVPGPGYLEAPAQLETLEQMGFDFVDLFAHHAPAWIWLSHQPTVMIAVDESYGPDEIADLDLLNPAAVEAAVIPTSGYGQPLTLRDLARYRRLREMLHCPIVIPSQRRVTPADAAALREIGIDGLMIGAVVTGADPGPMEEMTARFRERFDG